MLNEQCSTSSNDANRCHFSCLSWTAIFAGAFIGVGLGFLLYLFDIAIGLSITTTTHEGAVTLAIGGFIGMLIGTIASMFVAGFAAGHLGRPYCSKRNYGALYGFTAWCVALMLAASFSAPIGRYLSAYSAYVGNTSVHNYYDRQGNMTSSLTTTTTAPETVAATDANDAQVQAKTLGLGAFLLFILFAVGALASCFGGHCGMTCDSQCNRSNPNPRL